MEITFQGYSSHFATIVEKEDAATSELLLTLVDYLWNGGLHCDDWVDREMFWKVSQEISSKILSNYLVIEKFRCIILELMGEG